MLAGVKKIDDLNGAGEVLVGKAPTYAEAVAMAEREGEEDPVLIRIPGDWSPLAL